MRKSFSQLSHTVTPVLVTVILACLVPLTSGHAANRLSMQSIPSDSLARMASGYYAAEPTVQSIINTLNVKSAAVGTVKRNVFCTAKGGISAAVVADYSSLATQVSLLWYPKGSPDDAMTVLPAHSAPGDSVVFFLSDPASIGWCIQGPSGAIWYSEPELNADGRAHVQVFAVGDPGTYLLFWEDLALSVDDDFNDLIVRVRFPHASPSIELSYGDLTAAGQDSVGLAVAAEAAACTSAPVTVRMLEGAGTFEPVTAFGTVQTVHRFAPERDGLYTFVFEASAEGAAPVTDTLVIPVVNSASVTSDLKINVNGDNHFTICHPETLTVPFSISSTCQVTEVYTEPPAILDIVDSTVGYFTGVPFESCFYLVARDACGGKDSVYVCFIVDTSEPTVVNYPARLDTVLCGTGWVCYPVTMSGGEPPIQVTAIAPAYYNSAMQQMCYPVNATGVYYSTLVVQNATCPPDTCVTEIHAYVNTPPRFEGIPNTTVSVCGLAPYCFGPITCADDENNVISCVQTKGPGTFDGQTWCYTPTGTQTVSAIFRATDGCGKVGYDTLRVSFTASGSPVITFNDVTENLCEPQTVCVPYSISGGSGSVLSLIGPGALDVANSRVCLPVSSSGDYSLTLVATPPCGTPDTATATIHATINLPPSVVCSAPDVDTIAPGGEVCVGYTVSDPNGEALDITIQGPGFTIPRQSASGTSDDICFSVVQQGTQTVRIIVIDACGEADTCTASFPVWFNAGPSVTAPDTNVFLCSPEPVCIPITCSDPDGNLVTCNAEGSKPGTFSDDTFCFTPDTAGTYTIASYAEDAYGSSATHTSIVRVSYNAPPIVQIVGNDNVTVTAGETVCFSYTAGDPDGNLDAVTPSGAVASFNTSQICVTGIYSEVVCAWVVATDACGRKDSARVCVTSTPGNSPHPNLPDTVETRLCAEGDICVPFTIAPSDCPPMTLTALGDGTIQYGDTDTSVCLLVTAPGVYQTGVTATDLCGEETAEVVLIVLANTPPEITCPQPDPFFTCDGQQMCTSISYADLDGNFMEATASAGALESVSNGFLQLCFDADTSGWYTSQVIVRDSCGAADTCDFVRQVTRNTPPQILSPGDTAVFLCSSTEVCLPVSCYDPDDNALTCIPTSLGDAQWDGTDLCFTPPISGTYEWVFFIQDNCGEYTTDTVRAHVQINGRPTITAPLTIYAPMCEAESVLVDYEVSDPDGGPLITTIDGCEECTGDIKVFSDTSGTICYDLIVRDQCFAADTAHVCVTFEINEPPAVTAPDDFSMLLCGYTQACFDVDIEDDFSPWTASVSPIGTYNPADGRVCFTADTAGTYRLVITATDSCGAADEDTVNVTVNYNVAPVVTAPSQPATICAPGQVCVGGIRAYDANANLRRFYCATEGAVFDSSAGTLCFDAAAAGLYYFDIAAEDSCGESDLKTMAVNVGINVGPSVTIDGLEGSPAFNEPTELCFSIAASDPNTNQLFDLDMLEGAGTFSHRFSHSPISAQHCFLADTTGCYRFIFESTDSCGISARDTAIICLSVEPPDTMFQVCIDTVQSLNGRNATVKVRGIQMMEMGGYDFLICYDPTMLYFSQASIDSALSQWEYFTYRLGSATGCLPCGASSIRLVGIADMNNGTPHPPDWAFTPKGPLHKLTFFVTSDRTFLNQCASVRFCSYDCGDNTISSKSGDTTFTDLSGVPDTCFEGLKYAPVPLIEFCDGLVCIVPPEDDRGDLNLNGIANEVADAVLYSNWFIYGDVVWDPIYKENQILASDVNCDGTVLTVSDLVKLIRLITGDDQPQGCGDGPAKVAVQPSEAARISAERSSDGLEFWIESGIDLGGVYVRLSAPSGGFGRPQWDKELGGLTPQYSQTDGETRVLLVSMQSGTALPAGHRHLFTLPWDGSGKWTIEDVQSAGSKAEQMTTEIGAGADPLPKSYSLEQNYPNPFNASTQIRFNLGAAAAWEVTVYNVLGQVVRRFEGTNEAGEVSIEWDGKASDGSGVASGVYFTRLKVDKSTATRKMVLLK